MNEEIFAEANLIFSQYLAFLLIVLLILAISILLAWGIEAVIKMFGGGFDAILRNLWS